VLGGDERCVRGFSQGLASVAAATQVLFHSYLRGQLLSVVTVVTALVATACNPA
jgi:hypothetical protein